ncbi:MAG: hypothetical protein OEW35_10170 [Gammaproteobacteria bacterium]|nr:hypothetical protein [Gammaproteobacteria bacterium]MDH4255611.1 hypothetical protein [Gammaproteobacteria bacterium]MDH5310341.1 hypothetical protein [Gammaproteobacteria bacterium]
MTSNGYKTFQFFKYAIYAFLAFNVYLFFVEEWAALATRFADGVSLGELISAFPATIDTASWVVLLLMFELETYVLDDRHFTPRVKFSLHALRASCYAVIVYAFYGYLSKALFLAAAVPLNDVTDLCSLVGEHWSYAVDLDDYQPLDFSNCIEFGGASEYLQFRGLNAIVDPAGFVDIMRLAWVDVINAGVWILVVLVLETDVRLQEHMRLQGMAYRVSTAAKFVLYSVLLLAAIYWWIKGDFVDFWDAFLWLVAFVFIELNVFEWRKETLGDQSGATRAA